MGMSDCPKCWETPCACGYEYRDMTRERRIQLAAVILGVSPESIQCEAVPEQHPYAKEENEGS